LSTSQQQDVQRQQPDGRPVGSSLLELWPTPFLLRQIQRPAGYDEALRRLLLEREESNSGPGVGTVDATKTTSDLLRWDEPQIQPLRSWILNAVEDMNVAAGVSGGSEMVAEAWAVVYREWGYHKVHAHHDSAWSGVYYVATGDMVEGSGLIELIDPRPGAAARQPHVPATWRLSPRAGMLIAFPSWLQHWVTPYQGNEERICVAFNVGFQA